MIIKLLLDLIYGVMWTLTLPIYIPDLPSNVRIFINDSLGYISDGIGILSNYTDMNYLLVLFGMVVTIDVALWVYKVVMFIIKKVPMIGIE